MERKPFSLLRRGRSNGPGRFPDLGFFLLAAPSHPSCELGTVADCGFRRRHSGGTAPDLHRTSL